MENLGGFLIMSNVKFKVSFSLIMLLVTVMALSNVCFADLVSPKTTTSPNYLMQLSVSYNGKALTNNEVITLKNTDKTRTLTITTNAKYVSDKLVIYATRSGETRKIICTNAKSVSFGIPTNLREGYITSFVFEAVSNTTNYVGNSNGFQVKVACPETGAVVTTTPAKTATPAPKTTTPAPKTTPAPINDELIIEDWMRENKDLENLVVSLRNDSEQVEKENKNIYALNEEVTYYVDYKNGGKDTNKEVKLVLELPLSATIVDKFGGTYDKEKNTITWLFKNGLDREEAGTKVVKVKYTAFSRNNKKYEVVYPVAKVYVGNSLKDASAVINYIFKDEDTEITEEHYPYMLGDANASTFRPDDTITRAEGALVLARIFGIDFSGTIVRGDEFYDLDETYREAQKAIVAASRMGIISGYPDGSYRPNNKMTNAEFMKIIASYIEYNSSEDDIDGLEVKETDASLKLYKNPVNVYVMGNQTIASHWAINYVTFLARLNMTPVSESNRNLELDSEISRAKVAQLVNFYLLRAPAENGRTSFTDVPRNHRLYGDILEATRPVHTFFLTEEGTEVAEF